MAETEIKQKQMDLGPFTPEERAHFDSRGEKDIPSPPAAAPVPPKPPAEPLPPAEPPAPPAEPAPPPQDKPTHVPIATLQEERKRRQEADERTRQAELLNARMEERFRAFRDALTPRQAPPPAPPEVDRDIFGAVKHIQAEQRQTRAEIDGYKRQIQQEDALKQLKQWGANTEAEYVRANPDYYKALNHLRQTRARELQVWGMSPSAIGEQLAHEENQLLARAAAERRNPAEMAYALAKQRGYTLAPAAAPPPGPSTVDLNRIEAGQKQSASLSDVGGGAGRDIGDVEITDLLKMSDAEFGAFITKHPARFRRLKGAAH